MVECCMNCKYCIGIPRNNKYQDMDYLCFISSYYVNSIDKKRSEIKRFTPGGRELKCKYKQKEIHY